MALTKRTVGRPNKGLRHTFPAKLPLAEAEKLQQVLERQNVSAVAYVTKVLSEHLAQIDLGRVDGQEELPLSQAS